MQAQESPSLGHRPSSLIWATLLITLGAILLLNNLGLLPWTIWDTLARLWPIGKFPVLQNNARDRIVAESTTILEYLALHHPGPVALVPAEAIDELEKAAHGVWRPDDGPP